MRVRQTLDIRATPETIWPLLDDPDRMKEWMKGLLEDVPTSDGPTRIGSTFRMSLREGRRISAYEGTVLAYEPPSHLCVALRGGCLGEGATMTADYVLTPLDANHTRLEYTAHGDLLGLWRWLAPLVAVMARVQVRGLFRNLKRVAETDSGMVAA